MTELRILVADDQPEIARELLGGLDSKRLAIDYAVDGTTALERLRRGPVYDVAVVDMRMPPDTWGGLWLIEAMRTESINVPIIVFSGEAGQSETIKALRLGANDWVTKEQAREEIAERIDLQIERAARDSLAYPSSFLPAPIAEKVEHFTASAALNNSHLDRGLAALTAVETMWRLLALVNVASISSEETLKGVVPQQLLRPTMGIYLDLLKRSQQYTREHVDVQRLTSCMPLAHAQQIVSERNRGVGHPINVPELDASVVDIAEGHIATFVRRFSTNNVGFLGSARSMTFHSDSFRVSMQVYGASVVPAVHVLSPQPCNTGKIFWVGASGSIELWPWIVEDVCRETENLSVFLFDGVKVKGKDLGNREAPFIYTGCSARNPLDGGGQLSDLMKLFESDQT